MREDLKKRLMALNGGALSEVPPEPAPAPVRVAARRATTASPINPFIATPETVQSFGRPFIPSPESPEPFTEPTRGRKKPAGGPEIADLLPGRERDGAAGQHYCVEARLGPGLPEWDGVVKRFIGGWVKRSAPVPSGLKRVASLRPERLLFLDIETTGLSNCAVFLIGLMTWEDGGFMVRQHFARDFGEESAILRETADSIGRFDALVTFNGKSFDLPFIQNRIAHHRLAPTREILHIDLLHHARRRWRHELPNCRLQTLEQALCGRERVGDVPSSQIPGVYRHYVRTGDPHPIRPVFSHNLLDLVTMAELLVQIIGGST